MPSLFTAQVFPDWRDRAAQETTVAAIKVAAMTFAASMAALSPHAAAGADGSFAEDATAAWQEESRPAAAAAYSVDTLILPSLDGPWDSGAIRRPGFGGAIGGGSNATQRIDLTRWMTPEAPSSLGVSLGLNSAVPHGGAATFAPQAASSQASLDLGVRWRSPLYSGRRLDVSAWAQAPRTNTMPDTMGLIWQKQQLQYGTRVEVQWASSRTRGLLPEFGAVGVQLQGGSRLVLRAKKGGPMLYYRAKF